MSGGGTTATKVENKDPWGPAQPYLKQIMGHGSSLFAQGAGTQTWGGPFVAGMDPSTSQGLDLTNQIARQSMGSASQPYNFGQNLMQSNGLTSAFDQPMATFGGVASGQNGINTGQDFHNIAMSAGQPTAASQYLTGMASGADAGQNPYLMQMLDANAARIGNRVNSSMSGMGRYGSGGHTDLMARSIAEANNPLLAQAYESDRNRMLSATGQIDSSQRASEAARLAATQGQTGVQGMNIANQMGAAGQQAGILGQGLDRSAQWASMMPQLSAMQYDPANRMLMTGGVRDARAQQELDAQRQLFQQQQMMPWEHLNRYMGSIMGTSPLTGNAGTTTSTATQEQQTPWTQYAGLGLAGLGMLGAPFTGGLSLGLGGLAAPMSLGNRGGTGGLLGGLY